MLNFFKNICQKIFCCKARKVQKPPRKSGQFRAQNEARLHMLNEAQSRKKAKEFKERAINEDKALKEKALDQERWTKKALLKQRLKWGFYKIYIGFLGLVLSNKYEIFLFGSSKNTVQSHLARLICFSQMVEGGIDIFDHCILIFTGPKNNEQNNEENNERIVTNYKSYIRKQNIYRVILNSTCGFLSAPLILITLYENLNHNRAFALNYSDNKLSLVDDPITKLLDSPLYNTTCGLVSLAAIIYNFFELKNCFKSDEPRRGDPPFIGIGNALLISSSSANIGMAIKRGINAPPQIQVMVKLFFLAMAVLNKYTSILIYRNSLTFITNIGNIIYIRKKSLSTIALEAREGIANFNFLDYAQNSILRCRQRFTSSNQTQNSVPIPTSSRKPEDDNRIPSMRLGDPLAQRIESKDEDEEEDKEFVQDTALKAAKLAATNNQSRLAQPSSLMELASTATLIQQSHRNEPQLTQFHTTRSHNLAKGLSGKPAHRQRRDKEVKLKEESQTFKSKTFERNDIEPRFLAQNKLRLKKVKFLKELYSPKPVKMNDINQEFYTLENFLKKIPGLIVQMPSSKGNKYQLIVDYVSSDGVQKHHQSPHFELNHDREYFSEVLRDHLNILVDFYLLGTHYDHLSINEFLEFAEQEESDRLEALTNTQQTRNPHCEEFLYNVTYVFINRPNF